LRCAQDPPRADGQQIEQDQLVDAPLYAALAGQRAAREQGAREVRADEACGTGDEDAQRVS
jgi:hypothetical protein